MHTSARAISENGDRDKATGWRVTEGGSPETARGVRTEERLGLPVNTVANVASRDTDSINDWEENFSHKLNRKHTYHRWTCHQGDQ